jgi:hypothetical protein
MEASCTPARKFLARFRNMSMASMTDNSKRTGAAIGEGSHGRRQDFGWRRHRDNLSNLTTKTVWLGHLAGFA